MILSNPDKPWDYLNISRNPNITWEIIDKNKFKPCIITIFLKPNDS